MLNQLNSFFHKKYIAPELKANEVAYDKLFAEMFEKYEEHKDSHEFFKEVFEKLFALSNIKETFEEKLATLSETLSNSLIATADVVQKISFTLSQRRKAEAKVLSDLKCKLDEEVDLTHKKLISGMDYWANFLLGWSADIAADMTEFYRYKQHELRDFTDLLRERIQETNETEQRISLLETKKKQLFSEKKIGQWQIDPLINDFYHFVTDFDKIKEIMLPDETRVVGNSEKQCFFANKHVLYEYLSFLKNEGHCIK